MDHSNAQSSGLPVGALLDGKYEIVSLLGVGGMGEVYQARHTHLNTLRCIKVMRPSLAGDEAFRSRFLREARLATRVQHPNVAITHDFSLSDGGISYLVSEYIDGSTLRQWSRQNGRFAPDMAAEISVQVLSGLHEIHRQGLVHRDISADNIMIARDDDRWIAKIIDLGIAKALEGSAGENTQVGFFVGNPRYSSPEQVGDLPEGEAIDGRSDLYSLGVVIYEMLTGVAPFRSTTPHGYILKHLKETPKAFAEIDPRVDVPSAFEAVVFKALQKKRELRYATAREFARALYPFTEAAVRTVEMDIREFLCAAPTPPPQPYVDEHDIETGDYELPLTDLAEARDEAARRAEEIQRAFDVALDENSPPMWRLFLERHSDSALAVEAKAILDALETAAFEQFVAEGQPSALSRFLAEFPDGARVAQAKQLARSWREEEAMMSAWNLAVREDATALYHAFIASYPQSSLATEATRRIHEKEYLAKVATAVQRADRIALTFLSRASDAPAAANAAREALAAFATNDERRRLEEEWNAAWTRGSSEAFAAFIAAHPSSPFDADARAAITEAAAFENAFAAYDVRVIDRFLQEFPDGRHSAEMRIRAAELKEATCGDAPKESRVNPDAVVEQLRRSLRSDRKP